MALSTLSIRDRSDFFVEDFQRDDIQLLDAENIAPLEAFERRHRDSGRRLVEYPCPNRTHEKLPSASQVQPGDEVSTWFLFRERFNGIVESVDQRNSTLVVIGFKFHTFHRAVVEKVQWNFKEQCIYRVNYEESHNRRVTLARAKGSIGQKGYNLFFNQCRDFTTWCKTGPHDPDLNTNHIEATLDSACKIQKACNKRNALRNLEAVRNLTPAAHVGWRRDIGYWHHALVETVTPDTLTVIHFAPPENNESNIKGLINRKTFELNADLLKEMYEWTYEDSSPAEVALARAQICIGKRGYDFLANNCQHFVTWCKTGIVESKQVQDFFKLFLRSGLKSGGTLASQLPRLFLENAAADIASILAGSFVIVGIESLFIGKSVYDIHRKYKHNRERRSLGEPELDYNEELSDLYRHSTRTICTLIGFIIGECIWPVGGGFAGGFIGGLLGEGVYHAVSRGIPTLVKFIKDKIINTKRQD